MDDKKLDFNQPLLSVRRRGGVPARKCEGTEVGQRRIPPHRSELKSGPVRNPGVVPFLWEHTPGQPKQDVKPPTAIAPQLPLGSRDWEELSSDSGDNDEAYVDARDTLSRTESFSLNCSMSGLSGQGNGLPGSVSKEAQAREFMMDRFLPPAKAIASETTPQYLTKKPHVVQERVKKSEDQCNKPSLRYGPSFAKRYSNCQEKDEEEEESDDDYDRHQDFPAACGLLPRFCLRSSLCVRNPMPAMSVRTRFKKLVDRIQAAEVDDDKTRSRRNECGRLERRLGTSTHGDGLLPGREVKEAFAIPELKIHSLTKGFVSDGKVVNAFEESNSESPVIEKTLYVDTIQVVESLNLDTAASSHDDYFKKLKTINGDEESLPHAPGPGAFSVSHSIDNPNGKCGMEFPENRVQRTDSTITENDATERSEKHQTYSGHPVPPPLPKSPSDSWLCRTLPNLSLRLYPQNQFSKAPTVSDTKWETIVKTTKVHRRYSEESLRTVSET